MPNRYRCTAGAIVLFPVLTLPLTAQDPKPHVAVTGGRATCWAGSAPGWSITWPAAGSRPAAAWASGRRVATRRLLRAPESVARLCRDILRRLRRGRRAALRSRTIAGLPIHRIGRVHVHRGGRDRRRLWRLRDRSHHPPGLGLHLAALGQPRPLLTSYNSPRKHGRHGACTERATPASKR
jgi:hypothetical protein